jgi:hypothetical protein
MTHARDLQGPERPTRREETVAARRTLHRSARHLLHTLALEALGLGAWISGGAAGALGARGAAAVEAAAAEDAAPEGAPRGLAFARSADAVRRELGAALAALFSEPYGALRRGEGSFTAARVAAGAVPGVIYRPVGAAAAAVQRTCFDMQQAVETKGARD